MLNFEGQVQRCKNQRDNLAEHPGAQHPDSTKNDNHGRDGVAAVEFAIIANVLFILIFVSFEFSRLHLTRNLAQDAAYFAARQAMVPGATAKEANQEATRILSAMFDRGYQITVHPLSHESNEVTVEVSIDLGEVAFFTPMFLPKKVIRSVATMSTERYRGHYQHQAT